MGFSVYNAQGGMRHMADIVDNLDNIMKGMSSEQRAATLAILGFEARSQQAITPLLGMGQAIRDYHDKLNNASLFTNDVATKIQMNFTDQMTILWNRIKVVSIEIGARLAPMIKFLGNVIATAYELWSKLPDLFKDWSVYIAVAVAALGPLLVAVAGLGTAFATVAMFVAANPVAVYLAGIIALRVAMMGLSAVIKMAVVYGLIMIKDKIVGIKEAIEDLTKTQNKWTDYQTQKFQKQVSDLQAINDEKKKQAAIDQAIIDKEKQLKDQQASVESQRRMAEEAEAKLGWRDDLMGNVPVERTSANMAEQDRDRMQGELDQLKALKKEEENRVASGGLGPNALLDQMSGMRGDEMTDAMDAYLDSFKKQNPLFKEIADQIADTAKAFDKGMKWGSKWVDSTAKKMNQAGKEYREKLEAEQKKLEEEKKKNEEERKRKNEEMRRQREEFWRMHEDAQKGDSRGRGSAGDVFDQFNQTYGSMSGGAYIMKNEDVASEKEKWDSSEFWEGFQNMIAGNSEVMLEEQQMSNGLLARIADGVEGMGGDPVGIDLGLFGGA